VLFRSSGQRLRVKGHGIKGHERTGDFYAVLKIVSPRTLSDEDRAAIESMRDRLEDPRTGDGWA